MIPYRKVFLYKEVNTEYYSLFVGRKKLCSPVTKHFADWCIRKRNNDIQIYDKKEYELRVKESLGE